MNLDANYYYTLLPVLVELHGGTSNFPDGTKAWYHKEENDLWVILPEDHIPWDHLTVNGVTYNTMVFDSRYFIKQGCQLKAV